MTASSSARTFTGEQRAAALAVLTAYRDTCDEHADDLRHHAAHGVHQAVRDLPLLDQWERDYWDDVVFDLQIRLRLDDDEVQALIDTV